MKHVHHDLIVEWVKDTSKQIQLYLCRDWRDCHIESVTNDEVGEVKFRFKPREFTKCHWYPCIDSANEKSIYYYNGNVFCIVDGDDYGSEEVDSMKWVGESLGPIQFGEGK